MTPARVHAGGQHVAVVAIAGDDRVARLERVLHADDDGFLADIEVAEAADQPHAVELARPSPRSGGSAASRGSSVAAARRSSRVGALPAGSSSSVAAAATLRCAVAMLRILPCSVAPASVPTCERSDRVGTASAASVKPRYARRLLSLVRQPRPCTRGGLLRLCALEQDDHVERLAKLSSPPRLLVHQVGVERIVAQSARPAARAPRARRARLELLPGRPRARALELAPGEQAAAAVARA